MSSISELTHLRRSIRRMEAASAKIMLERLREEWNEVADAAVYRELELEKQLWMLCALRSLNKKKDLNKTTSVSSEKSADPAKVLSLFENHGLCPGSHLEKALTFRSFCIISLRDLDRARSSPFVTCTSISKVLL